MNQARSALVFLVATMAFLQGCGQKKAANEIDFATVNNPYSSLFYTDYPRIIQASHLGGAQVKHPHYSSTDTITFQV